MESVLLSSFYRSVSVWPKTDMAVREICEKVRELIDVKVVALSIPEVGMKILDEQGTHNKDLLKDLITKQITNQLTSCSNHLRQVQLDQSAIDHIDHLIFAQICGEQRSGDSDVPSGRTIRNFGWLAVGSSKALCSKKEILLTSAAQHLSYLNVISQLDNNIALRDQFLSIASHELKTPLTSIYGILQLQERLLKRKYPKGGDHPLEKQLSFLQIVIRQVKRLNDLIDGLLNVSRIQNGRFLVEPSDIDVASTTREVLEGRLNVIAQEAGVRIQADIPSRLIAYVDSIRLEEVITNLVMNSIRYSPEGGMVWIKLSENGEFFHLSVKDQGLSIPKEDKDRIFQPFERAKAFSRLGGLGLGLFISRQIARLHRGDVVLAESIPGKGNLYEARFPLKAVHQKASA